MKQCPLSKPSGNNPNIFTRYPVAGCIFWYINVFPKMTKCFCPGPMMKMLRSPRLFGRKLYLPYSRWGVFKLWVWFHGSLKYYAHSLEIETTVNSCWWITVSVIQAFILVGKLVITGEHQNHVYIQQIFLLPPNSGAVKKFPLKTFKLLHFIPVLSKCAEGHSLFIIVFMLLSLWSCALNQ